MNVRAVVKFTYCYYDQSMYRRTLLTIHKCSQKRNEHMPFDFSNFEMKIYSLTLYCIPYN